MHVKEMQQIVNSSVYFDRIQVSLDLVNHLNEKMTSNSAPLKVDLKMPIAEGVVSLSSDTSENMEIIFSDSPEKIDLFHPVGKAIIAWEYNKKDHTFTYVKLTTLAADHMAKIERLIRFLNFTFVLVMQHVEDHSKGEVVLTESTIRVPKAKKPKGGKGKNRSVIMKKRIISLELHPNYEPPVLGTYSNIDESKDVKGHYRTLKSGKRIWIKSYTRSNKTAI